MFTRKNVLIGTTLILSFIILFYGKMHYDKKVESIAITSVVAYEEHLEAEVQEKVDEVMKVYQKLDLKMLDSIDIRTFDNNFINKLISGDKINIVFLGDSTTQQNYTTNEHPNHVGVIESTLKNINGFDINVINAGITGNTIIDMFERLDDDVISKRPDVVIINSGLNDAKPEKNISTSNFEKTFEKVIEKLIEETNAEIYLRTSNLTDTEATNTRVKDEFRPILKGLAETHDLGYVDLYDYYESAIDNIEGDLYHFNYDDYHPNELGQQLIADALLYVFIKSSGLDNTES